MEIFVIISITGLALSILNFFGIRRLAGMNFKVHNAIIEKLAEVSVYQNKIAYDTARYILAHLEDKTKTKDLTAAEQEYFHECRKTIFIYETEQAKYGPRPDAQQD